MSENKSTYTFTSMKKQGVLNYDIRRQMKKMEFLKGNNDIIKESISELVSDSDQFINMKSEHMLTLYATL